MVRKYQISTHFLATILPLLLASSMVIATPLLRSQTRDQRSIPPTNNGTTVIWEDNSRNGFDKVPEDELYDSNAQIYNSQSGLVIDKSSMFMYDNGLGSGTTTSENDIHTSVLQEKNVVSVVAGERVPVGDDDSSQLLDSTSVNNQEPTFNPSKLPNSELSSDNGTVIIWDENDRQQMKAPVLTHQNHNPNSEMMEENGTTVIWDDVFV